jgi:hypothetical protein
MKQSLFLALSFLLAGFFTACEKENLELNSLSELEFRGESGPLSWNDACPGDDLTLTLTGTGAKQIQQDVDGDWVNVASGPNNSDPLVATVENVQEGTYLFRYRVGGGGFTEVTITIEPCCVNDLSVVLVCGETRMASFTFTAEEAGPIVIQGGLTAGAVIVSATSNVLTQNTTHSSVVNSTASVTRWEGDVDACTEVTVTITFTGGNGIGDWTAKRGEVTLGSTDEESCN